MEFLIVLLSIAWIVFGMGLLLASGDESSKKIPIRQAIAVLAIEISLSILLAAFIISYNLPKH